jgi:hypothetical protein
MLIPNISGEEVADLSGSRGKRRIVLLKLLSVEHLGLGVSLLVYLLRLGVKVLELEPGLGLPHVEEVGGFRASRVKGEM